MPDLPVGKALGGIVAFRPLGASPDQVQRSLGTYPRHARAAVVTNRDKILTQGALRLCGFGKNDYFCGQLNRHPMAFINEKVRPEGLTFDDVLLVPA